MQVPDDPSEALALLVIRLRSATEADREAIVEKLLPLFADRRVPLPVRLAAAGRAIDALPDTLDAIRGVVEALTAGVPPTRAIQRLHQLQNLTETATALDELVTQTEQKVRLACPRCGVLLAHAEMVKHLWHEHGLTLVEEKTRGVRGEVDAIRREYATIADPALFDRVAEVGGELAMRAWVAETASEEELLPVCAAARERGAGLCSVCFADVAPALPELPPPLAVADGRIAGDGYVATAASAFSPRISATLAGVLVLVGFVLLAPLFRGRLYIYAFLWSFVLAAVAYLVTFIVRLPRTSPDERAIDAAWRKLAPRLADRRRADRFLTRLCLTSLGRGDPLERANALGQVIARARENPDERQLLAAALVLQIDDGARFGRDRAEGIAELVAQAFGGDQPAEFAEYVLAAYLRAPRAQPERERLRILLQAAAFGAKLTPRDVLDLCDAAPHIAEAMRLPAHHGALLYGLWLNRSAQPWAKIDEARTVLELASAAPTTAAKLLVHEPGLLLVCGTHPQAEEELGPILIAVGGVSVGGVVTLDPAADVRVEAGGRELIFGKHALKLSRAIPAKFADELKAWLRFRSEVLAVYPAMYLRNEPLPAMRLLTPFLMRCPSCGKQCTPVVGAVAPPLRS